MSKHSYLFSDFSENEKTPLGQRVEHLLLQSGFVSAATEVDLNSLDVCTLWDV